MPSLRNHNASVFHGETTYDEGMKSYKFKKLWTIQQDNTSPSPPSKQQHNKVRVYSSIGTLSRTWVRLSLVSIHISLEMQQPNKTDTQILRNWLPQNDR
jgi:hypothetical protein